MSQVTSAMAVHMIQTPTGIASKEWPEPERFPQLLDKLGALLTTDYDWSAEVKRLQLPVMLLYADHDAIPTRHIADFFALLGGGLKDPGWQDTKFTNAPELAPIIDKFLTDSLSSPQGGAAAAASKAAP